MLPAKLRVLDFTTLALKEHTVAAVRAANLYELPRRVTSPVELIESFDGSSDVN
jgi:hypothetical protein